ncbi:MAG: hypothetical protein KKA51_04460, partial [Nanoarchaeota archaeon]|nr:hypothetical protein [Nanoarchaeota archaeon]
IVGYPRPKGQGITLDYLKSRIFGIKNLNLKVGVLNPNKISVEIFNKNWQVIGFEEKVENPTTIPGNEKMCLASMGNYAFKPSVLLEELVKDDNKKLTKDKEQILKNPEKYTSHDFGFDIIPSMLRNEKKIFAYNFGDHLVPGAKEKERGFWRDIGNIDQFYKANMEVKDIEPLLNLYNEEWKVLTYIEQPAPYKNVGEGTRFANSIAANGVITSHASIDRSVISYRTQIEKGAHVEDSILLGYDYIDEGAIIKRAIIDRNVHVPKGETVGVDRKKDLARGFTVSPGGITVVPKGYEFK